MNAETGSYEFEVYPSYANKVDAVAGKGLSTKDYTAEDQSKLHGLPDAVYSKSETDSLLAASGGLPTVVQQAEHVVGIWVDPLFGDRHDLWERIISLDVSTLGGDAGSVQTVTLVETLTVEPESWLRVVDTSLLSAGSVYPLADAVVRIYQSGASLMADIRKPAQSTGTLSVQLRYVKYTGDILTFELKVPEGTDLAGAALTFPRLKYFKKAVLTPTCDDSNVTAYCNLWARMNHYRRYNTPGKKYFHKGWTPEADDTFTIFEPTDFDNGTGRRIRYSFSCAIWPSWGNEYSPNGFITDSSASVHNPYICWDELREMQDFGISMMYHNVDERTYGKSDPARIVEGYAADRLRTYDKLGVWMKLLGQPDGNAAYIDAAKSTPLVQMMRQSVPTGEPVYLNDAQDLYHYGVRSSYATGNDAKLVEIAEQIAAENPCWVSVTWHETNWEGDQVDFFDALYAAYSANADTDQLWVTSWDNMYEWMYTRLRGRIELDTANVRTADGFAYIPVRVCVPGKPSFYFRDASLLFSTAAGLTACEVVGVSDNVLKAECALAGSEARINLNFDPKMLERAERYTARFEASADMLDRTSALYFAGWLSDELAAPLIARIDAVRSVPIESLSIEGPATLTTGAVGTFTVTALPADNTRMESIELTASAGLSLVSKSVRENVLTATYRAAAEGAASVTAACDGVSATYDLSVTAAVYYLKLDGTQGDLTFADQSAAGGTLSVAAETNGTLKILSKDARLTVEIPTGSGDLSITVPANAAAEAVTYEPIVLGIEEDSAVRCNIAISQVAAEQTAYRIVASFGYDWHVASGGVYDADGGYTKIRLTGNAGSGKLYTTDGVQAGTYTWGGALKATGTLYYGPTTGDDSALYKDYAIESYYFLDPAETQGIFSCSGLQSGKYRARFFLNTGNQNYSKDAITNNYNFVTSEGTFHVVMPEGNNDMWYQNWERYVDTEVVVGQDGELRFTCDRGDKTSGTVCWQIIDLEKV